LHRTRLQFETIFWDSSIVSLCHDSKAALYQTASSHRSLPYVLDLSAFLPCKQEIVKAVSLLLCSRWCLLIIHSLQILFCCLRLQIGRRSQQLRVNNSHDFLTAQILVSLIFLKGTHNH
jgi:hypothetical protein